MLQYYRWGVSDSSEDKRCLAKDVFLLPTEYAGVG
jgi:hypothetical protein